MQIILPDMEKLVKDNHLPEVTNPVYIEGNNTPTVDGIFSYETFGRPGGSKRKFQYGFIDLGKPFLHPVAYMQLSRLFTKLPEVIAGRKKFRLDEKGSLIEDEEKGETGIDFIYKNFEKLHIDDKDVKIRKARVELLASYTKKELFCTKWLTIPPFYFDINLRSGDGARSIDELGSLYIKLISLSKILRNEGNFFTAFNTEANIQQTLVDIYNLFTAKISKKQGLIHRDILGKNVDYTVRGVISCPKIRSANTYKDQEVMFGYVGIPLYQLATLFFPFVVAEMERFLQSLSAYSLYLTNSKGLEILDNTIDTISSTNFEKVIKLYTKSPENRMQEFKITTSEGGNALESYEKTLGRKFTITDFLYLCVSEVIKDKFVIMVRYPLEDYRNVSSMRPIILTTEQTKPQRFFGGERWNFECYPDFSAKPLKWIDSIRPNISYLEGYGGDFDGDCVSLKGLFTQEANMEMAVNNMKPANLLSPSAEESRVLRQDAFLAFYSITR
jgi:DNA-directed RNA polymerase beta' subunit